MYKASKLVLREFPGALMLSGNSGLGVLCYDPDTMTNTKPHFDGEPTEGRYVTLYKEWTKRNIQVGFKKKKVKVSQRTLKIRKGMKQSLKG